MDINEVTLGQFKRFVQQSGYNYEGDWSCIAYTHLVTNTHDLYVTWVCCNGLLLMGGQEIA